MGQPTACTKCKTRIAFTEDWMLWPWPDGAWLCTTCNDARHETDDFAALEAAARAIAQPQPVGAKL